jgi:hypothetical protein
MYPENDYYGHKMAFAKYCGKTTPLPILGSIHHGWEVDLDHLTSGLLPLPRFLFNCRLVAKARQMGFRNVECIGAPFAYLIRSMWPANIYPQGEGTIFFLMIDKLNTPNEADLKQGLNTSRKLIEEIEAEFRGPYTVKFRSNNLHEEVKKLYLDSGWRVIYDFRNNPKFLENLAEEIVGHENVVGNELQTSLIYGAALGRNVHITTRKFSETRGDYFKNFRRLIPALYESGLKGELATNFGRSEIGWDNVLSPRELEIKLGWNSVSKIWIASLLGKLIDLKYSTEVRKGTLY